ncbi:unnamed protein product [Sphenostylis stenocarpa]|uniref:Uncharacterized protein n=1 Tax=Sphenostylis stenocarpa TaxID=92480 RepID=A0AA86T273_9FABA|nr:unnamed protein product [Sphenostylis stenocarpa]
MEVRYEDGNGYVKSNSGDKALQEQNNTLAKKIKEKEKALAAQQTQMERQGDEIDLASSVLVPQPLETSNIRGCSQVRDDGGDNEGTATPSRANAILPPWMLRPTNE